MWGWILELDRVLRGEKTRPEALRTGSIDVPVVGLSAVLILLAALYGVCAGTFAALRGVYVQMLASALKVPLLFLLTLVVTFPSLYVFNALVGSKLSVGSLLKLLVASLCVILALLAAFGPITAFFSISTTSYSFMVLLNVAVFAVSGGLGLLFLMQTLHRLTVIGHAAGPPGDRPPDEPPAPDNPQPGGGRPDEPLEVTQFPAPGALDKLQGHVLGAHVKSVFRCWLIVFGLVGAQMGWLLRPFIGDPNLPFQWFRERESNFFEAILGALLSFFR